ncbi:MAG: hypothetical protein SFY80_03570 [Verrucomicrobiota bacterium]|nr:hypothetical protein [Verrucomicrobiota bacterium]
MKKVLFVATLITSTLALSLHAEEKKSGFGAFGDMAKKAAADATGIPTDLASLGQKFVSSLKGTDTVGLAQSALTALGQKKDSVAVQSLTKIAGAKLTPAQLALFGDFKDAASTFVLQRNFDWKNAQLKGSLGTIAEGIKTKNYLGVVAASSELLSKAKEAKLTDGQTALLTSVKDLYNKFTAKKDTK